MSTETIEDTGVLTEIKSLAIPDMAIMNRAATSALRMAQSLAIATDDDYRLAGEELQSVKGRIARMEAARTSITGPMNKALKAVNDMFRGPMKCLTDAENVIKQSMLDYFEEQQRKAEEERIKAEKAAELERMRIAEEARQVELRAAEERKRIADEAAAAVAAAQHEQEKLSSEANASAQNGDKFAAEEAQRKADEVRMHSELLKQQAEQRANEVLVSAHESVASLRVVSSAISAPVSTNLPAKAAGTSVKGTVEYELTSLISLVQHVASHPELVNLLCIDSVKLRAYVRGLGLNTNLPGVRVFQKRSMSARAS